MKVKDVLIANHILRDVFDNSNVTDSKVKFQILTLLKQFEPVVENYNTVREDKIKELGVPNKEGQIGIFPPMLDDYGSEEDYQEAYKLFQNKVQQYEESLVSVEETVLAISFSKIKFDTITAAGLDTSTLLALYDFIEE